MAWLSELFTPATVRIFEPPRGHLIFVSTEIEIVSAPGQPLKKWNDANRASVNFGVIFALRSGRIFYDLGELRSKRRSDCCGIALM
jgi:hypothetical protein